MGRRGTEPLAALLARGQAMAVIEAEFSLAGVALLFDHRLGHRDGRDAIPIVGLHEADGARELELGDDLFREDDHGAGGELRVHQNPFKENGTERPIRCYNSMD
ncbi:MAG TPA: hypothetical protein VJ579_00670 [Candidatus Paceibacterota bacterium]|nr:hypothetical protein [Candidatus Paceibacterota bacterium]